MFKNVNALIISVCALYEIRSRPDTTGSKNRIICSVLHRFFDYGRLKDTTIISDIP